MKNNRYVKDVGWVIWMSFAVNIPYVLGISLYEISTEALWLLAGLVGGVVGAIFQLVKRPKNQDKEEDSYSVGIFLLSLLLVIILTFVMLFALDPVSNVRTGFIDGFENIIYGWVFGHLYVFVFGVGLVVKAIKGKKIKINLVPILICLNIIIATTGTMAIVNKINETKERREQYEEHIEVYEEEVAEQAKRENTYRNRSETKPSQNDEKEKVNPDGPFDERECRQIMKIAKQFEYDWELESFEKHEWPGLTWKKKKGEYHVVELDFSGRNEVKGNIDLSGFEYLRDIDLCVTNVTEVTIPKSAKSIDLEYCRKLKKITFCEGIKGFDQLYLPDGWPEDEYSLKQIVFLGDAPRIEYTNPFNRDIPIYRKKESKGWDDEVWKYYNLKFLG